MSRTVIHIGANKTGSTTFQRHYFAHSKHLAYLGEDCADYARCRETLNSMVSDDDIHFRPSEMQPICDRLKESSADRTILYSNEDIMSSRVPSLCCRRLRHFFPDADILVVLRNQLTAVPSWYANHGAFLKGVPRRYWRRYVSFDDWMKHCIDFTKYSPLDSYFYHRITRMYADLFGAGRIRFLLYEDLVGNRDRFLTDLCAILGSDVEEAREMLAQRRERTRYTERQLRYHRLRSALPWKRDVSELPPGASLPGFLRKFLEGGPPACRSVSDHWMRTISALYAEDNAKLAREFDLPLGEFGYPLA